MSNQSSDVLEDMGRSIAFSDKPSQPIHSPELNKPPTVWAMMKADNCIKVPKRDDRLALIEELEPGPYEHKAPFDDPHFERLEPHSRICLKCVTVIPDVSLGHPLLMFTRSRSIPHADIQEYLTGRFYISPSRLYSIVRLLPNQQGYDVPVAGDWVTIAVVAERGEIKHTRAPVGIGRDGEDGDGLEGGSKAPKKFKGKKNPGSPQKPGKKYVNIKLIDFGARSSTESSATGGKAVIRGDAFLNLLLFEADSFDVISGNDGMRPQKIYRGGSRGAFEAMSKLKEGDVVALLNPKILKPFQVRPTLLSFPGQVSKFISQGSSNSPHPVNNILAITPESASSIIVIGRSRDLGMCNVTKRDGKLCGTWCDKRVSDVCEYHVQHAIENRRAGRAEFAVWYVF
jgi:minichromosome maintenance protein 10